ncbi:MAG: manganese efflux pump MntP family protein [candidate division KSB1 bacterium]|nr:manganese efflux pump MntP family protein [candidate division KSB1 bacterium]MDZ7346221.1 manganese efflux pump MntP family protein [candidate division KSB1 bacterium]MDZ7371585.1 manganese efflux pump MntP family protein [candidate division KSB1 bacterium]
MPTLEIILLACGLAMDALAVSISVGTTPFLCRRRARFRISFHFGLFQCIMPIIGWFGGKTIAPLIHRVDHWAAFGLLAFVGGKMIRESLSSKEKSYPVDPSRGWNLILLSIATSIDALAVGFSLALVKVDIWYPALMIGLITGGLSLLGVLAGGLIGKLFSKRAELLGGLVLIAIGLRILISHLSH